MSLPEYYYNDDTNSFAFSTCRERWPKILQDAIDDVNATSAHLQNDSTFANQGQEIVKGISQIRHELETDTPLSKFTDKQVAEVPGLSSFNATLDKFLSSNRYDSKHHQLSWLSAPWLFTECYLYRRVDALVKTQPKWVNYDIFHNLKQKSFKSSAVAVYELAKRYKALHEETFSKLNNPIDLEFGKILFKEYIDVCLWGNKIDLSLLANKSQNEVHSGQSAKARQEAEKNILSNDTEQIWEYLSTLPKENKRIDFVLDNSGFETFTDLNFALFLLDTKLASQVVIHCKTRPWMVSDSLIKDIDILLNDLTDANFFPESRDELTFTHDKIKKYLESGAISLQDSEFWTIDLDYWNIDPSNTKYYGAALYHELSKSDLVFIKGDLNYRKLTADRKWPKTEKFTKAIGPLASTGLKIVALRTCKADVTVGLPEGVNEALIDKWHKETDEIGELWSSSGNWAVISFSKGDLK